MFSQISECYCLILGRIGLDPASDFRSSITTNRTESTTAMPEQPKEPNQQQTCRNNEQDRINNRHIATTSRHATTNWLPIRMMYHPNSILEPLSTFSEETVSHWMAHWCGIAHDHAEIDRAK
jgi:hypothetical protein